MTRYLITFLVVIYTPNKNTDAIKVYNLQKEKPYEIVETLGDAYNQENKNDVEYQEVVRAIQNVIYPDCDYCDF